jgi:excisionase family DNA binding protein
MVRPIRVHGLRHAPTTLLLRSGVPLVVLQKGLRHRDPKLTKATCGHLATDYLRAEVNRLKLEGMPLPEAPRSRAASARVTPGYPLGQKDRRGRSCAGNPSDSDPFVSGRQDSNLRPLGPEAEPVPSSASTGVQSLATIQGVEGGLGRSTRPGRSGTLRRVPPVSPTCRHGLPGAHPQPESLLSVRDVADRLRVSTATVYALCDRGELPHLRVSNAIRMRVEDLEAFTRRGRP